MNKIKVLKTVRMNDTDIVSKQVGIFKSEKMAYKFVYAIVHSSTERAKVIMEDIEFLENAFNWNKDYSKQHNLMYINNNAHFEEFSSPVYTNARKKGDLLEYDIITHYCYVRRAITTAIRWDDPANWQAVYCEPVGTVTFKFIEV